MSKITTYGELDCYQKLYPELYTDDIIAKLYSERLNRAISRVFGEYAKYFIDSIYSSTPMYSMLSKRR